MSAPAPVPTRIDAPRQAIIGERLALLCRLYEAGAIQGLMLCWREREPSGRIAVRHSTVGLTHAQISHALLEALLDNHLDHLRPAPEGESAG